MIYLDNAATSWPKPAGVPRAVAAAMRNVPGNPGRTSHRLSYDAIGLVQQCRENLARLFAIGNPLRICWMASTTEALNTAIKGVLNPGDHAICTSMEHNSVWRPLTALQQSGLHFSIATADNNGIVAPERIERLLQTNTRLIVVNHASNVNGAIQPLAAIGALARSRGIAFLVDAAQSAGAIPIDVEAMGIDLLAFPGHKGLMGPQGIAGLYVNQCIQLKPLKEGGTGSHSNSPDQPAEFPDRLEAGTLNLPGIAGLNYAVNDLLQKGVATVARHEQQLTRRLIQGLQAIDGVTVYGPPAQVERAAVVSFNLRDLDPAQVAAALEQQADIACRPGWHCAGLAHRTLGTTLTGTVRLSPGPFTRRHEIDSLLEAVARIAARQLA